MAYDAAIAEGVPQTLIDIYLCHVVKLDLAWYVENGLLTRTKLAKMEAEALDSAAPLMKDWVDKMEVEPYVKAPIVSDLSWTKFVQELQYFHNATGASHVVDTAIKSAAHLAVNNKENTTIKAMNDISNVSLNEKPNL